LERDLAELADKGYFVAEKWRGFWLSEGRGFFNVNSSAAKANSFYPYKNKTVIKNKAL